jgi:hypothetical protein
VQATRFTSLILLDLIMLIIFCENYEVFRSFL